MFRICQIKHQNPYSVVRPLKQLPICGSRPRSRTCAASAPPSASTYANTISASTISSRRPPLDRLPKSTGGRDPAGAETDRAEEWSRRPAVRWAHQPVPTGHRRQNRVLERNIRGGTRPAHGGASPAGEGTPVRRGAELDVGDDLAATAGEAPASNRKPR